MPRGRADQILRRLLHPAYRRLETTVHPLRYLFLEITQRCNLRCRHCGSDCTKDTQLEELTTDEWLRVLDMLRDRFPPRSLILVLTGGEPFCRPDLDVLLRRAHANGLPWGMVTNGYALTPANVAKVRALGISSLTVSLDGLRASHDWLRGVPGAYDRALAGLRNAAAAGIPFFDVVTCVGPRNLDELPQVLEVLQGAGVRAWRLFSIFPKGRARGDAELLLPPAGLRRLLDWIAATRRRLAGTGFAVTFSCEGYVPGDLDRAVRDEPYFCRAGISIGSILCDGAISACPNIARELVQGNVRTDDFPTVWESRFQRFRDRGWMRAGRCVGCDEWGRCLGNSMHLWDDAAGETALCTHDAILGRLE